MSESNERIKKLTKPYGGKYEYLNYKDLILLVENDPRLRQLILTIFNGNTSIPLGNNKQLEIEHPIKILNESELETLDSSPVTLTGLQESNLKSNPAIEKNFPNNLIFSEFSHEHAFLKLIQQDTEFFDAWFGNEAPALESRQLVKLIAIAAQWEQILLLWDRLATRCKTQQRAINPAENAIMQHSIIIHNLIWQHGKQAHLKHTQINETFNPKQHERGTAKGDIVNAEWLPGLANAAGMLQRKILVKT
jgi:hypothetical protein